MKHLLGLVLAMLCIGVLGAQELVLSEIPRDWSPKIRQPLEEQRKTIQEKWNTFLEHRKTFAAEFAGTEEGTARAVEAQQRKAALQQEADGIVDEADRFNAAITVTTQQQDRPPAIPINVKAIIDDLERMAGDWGWSGDKIARLHQSFLHLGFDHDFVPLYRIQAVWDDIDARDKDSVQAKEAVEQGHGPGFPSMGQQTDFNDCTIFALANAARVPYGLVAAKAAEMISDSTWRSEQDRRRPRIVMKRTGLNGAEVIMLAEAFGEAEVVPVSEFTRVLSAGRRVLVNVALGGGQAHEVLISRTFTHEGRPWFEMINSHDDPNDRSYLSLEELDTIMLENGVAYRQERNRTAPLLR